ncbi:chemotaxis protein CheC [Novispirillum sp. DQ9]|uniref:chemotaxis protein CheC n=1 Tax=Novispirillum sp. DQ9 TaxID=3398612 RepID=UPI003C7C366F
MTDQFFSDVQRDALTEMMNLGVGRAASAFSKLVGDEVLLSVPEVSLTTVDDAVALFGFGDSAAFAGVMESFDGFIDGTAALLFPGERSLELVRVVVGEDMPAEEISELEEETLAEIGNIILNNCLATVANVLRKRIHTSLPETYRATGDAMFPFLQDGEGGGDGSAVLLLVQIDFSLRERDIRGFLAFLIDLKSTEAFRAAIDEYLGELGV